MKQIYADAKSGQRTYHLLLLTIILSALAIRLYKLDAQSLWYDEGVTAIIAQRGLTELTRWTARDIQPPLYYYQMAGWGRLAGWSEWSLRFPSAFWGTIAIPLMALLALQLTQQRLAGLLVALLTAFHPLLIYYSQEARMYTLLVAIGLLAGSLLARNLGLVPAAGQRQTVWRNWLFYVVAAMAAVYTHYFAFFLLLAFGLLFLVAAQRQPPHRWLWSVQARWFLFANLLVLLLYLAWIATLFTRLAVDSSYWQGRMKIGEALQQVAISFTSGETMLEAAATRLLLPYFLVTLLALAGLHGFQHTVQTGWARPLYFALIWLGVPVFCVLLLTGFVPKFNPRYVLLALPGLLLIWGCGLSWWLLALFSRRGAMYPAQEGRGAELDYAGRRQPPSAQSKSAPLLLAQRLGQSFTALIAIGFLLFGFGLSLQHWFTDPAFTKAQWRELSRYVREKRAPTETIVLVSGHAWPIWDYYAPDLAAVRLPDLEILDVNAVLDFANSAPPLQKALAGKTGAWLVTWQDEVIDPTGVAPLQLALAGQEQRVKAEFWHLGLRHFTDINPAAFRGTPPLDQRVNADFDNKLRLLGYAVAPNGDLLLTWQLGEASPPTRPDYQITLQTLSNGLLYAQPQDRRPADYNFPVMRWRPQQQVLGRIPASVWAGAGALPGVYQLHVGVYDPAGDLAGLDLLDAAGAPAGKRTIFTVILPQATPAEVDEEPTSWPLVAPAVHLQLQTTTTTVEPGQWFELDLHWFLEQTPRHAGPFTWRWRRQPDSWVIKEAPLEQSSIVPIQQWPTGQLLRQRTRVQTPLAAPPGAYWLELGANRPVEIGARFPLTVIATIRQFVSPPVMQKLNVGFFYPNQSNASNTVNPALANFYLVGLLETPPTTATVGSTVTVTLVWQAAQSPTAPLTEQDSIQVANLAFTTQLLGADGLPAPQMDLPLTGGNQNWLPGQVETQAVTLRLPDSPGEYRLIVAVYDPNSVGLPRLQTTEQHDWVELGRLRVMR